MTWQDEMFVERLVRLDQNYSRMDKLRMRRGLWVRGPVPRWTIDLGRALSVLGAGLIGFAAVPLSRFAMFQSRGLGNPVDNPHLVMATDGIFAFCIAFFLVRMMLIASTKAHMISQVAGIWLALVTMHNFVHAQPDLWAKAFSPKWVQVMKDTTEPGTIFIFGTGFP